MALGRRLRADSQAQGARGDALDRQARALLHAGNYEKALPIAAELVELRERAEPVDHALQALALGLHGTLLFAVGRSEDSDVRLRESLQAWREAYGPHDVRTAQKLELHAEWVEKNFGRTASVIELLREGVAIREADAASPRGKLAERLAELAIHEIVAGEFSAAVEHLARADALLLGELEPGVAAEEWGLLRVQVLVMRSGIAARLADRPAAERFAEAAAAVEIAPRAAGVEAQLLVSGSLSLNLAMLGDLDAAIAEAQHELDIVEQNLDLFGDPPLTFGLVGDSSLSLATLYLDKGEIDGVSALIDGADKQGADPGAVLFARADLARRLGDEAAALQHYRAALKLRKERAAEVAVLFGTNRLPVAGAEAGCFGAEAGAGIVCGHAAVLVPGAQFSTRTWMPDRSAPPIPVGRATDATALLIRAKRVAGADRLTRKAGAIMRTARLHRDAALVFVHGFNVSFDDALRRGAQLARDLNFDGPMFVFSWPSKGSPLFYGTDRDSADAAVERLVEFMALAAGISGARRIHVIAHSMGNRVLLPALARIAEAPTHPARARLAEVVLAAPAVPEDEFTGWLDRIARARLGHVTLYASAVDRALWIGRVREGGSTLAGYSSHGRPLTHRWMDSIDITAARSGDWFDLNHDVFASNPVMTEDIRQLLQSDPARSPEERLPVLLSKSEAHPDYWSYDPARRPVDDALSLSV